MLLQICFNESPLGPFPKCIEIITILLVILESLTMTNYVQVWEGGMGWAMSDPLGILILYRNTHHTTNMYRTI